MSIKLSLQKEVMDQIWHVGIVGQHLDLPCLIDSNGLGLGGHIIKK